MRKLVFAAVWLALTGILPARADVLFNALGAAGAVSGTDILACYQGGNPVLGCTPALLDTYLSATTKTLTNKTLTSPVIAGGALSGTFSGTPTFSGAVSLSGGGALSGTFSGTPTLSGNLTFSGVPLFTGLSAGTQTKCLGLDSGNNLVYTASACGSGAGTGTVTSVDFSVPATSIFGISGNPVTTSGTLALTTTGTSGGIPYFSSGTALSTSAALTASRLVLGGGAGAAPTVLGSLGTTTTLLHGNAAGAPTFAAVSLTADVSGITPVANGGTGIASGTSGGVLAYTASGTLASSGALTANLPVIGGGAGVAPSVGTRSGNTTAFVTTTGAQTSGDCVKIDANGNHIANGSACGGGSVSITAATPNIVVTPSPLTGTGTVGTTVTLDTQSGNSAYTIVSGDNTKAVARTNTVTQTDIIPQATGSFASGFAIGYSTATVGNTLTATTSTINGITGATGIKVGAQQELGCNSDGTNWACMLGLPQPATQTGTTVLRDDMTWTAFGTAGAAATGTSGHTLPYLDGANTFSGTQTFGTVLGTMTTQTGTTYTLAATDCGTTIRFNSGSSITLTTLNSLTVGCAIAVLQAGAGQITVSNGSGATFNSAHSYTKTVGQYGVIGLYVDTNSGGSSAHLILTGDGAT